MCPVSVHDARNLVPIQQSLSVTRKKWDANKISEYEREVGEILLDYPPSNEA